MPIVITGIEKQGPVIICSTNDSKNRVYKLDFQTGKIYGIAGKPIQSTCSIVDKIPQQSQTLDNALCAALRVFGYAPYNEDISYYNIVESLLSYPDLIPSTIDTNLIKSIRGKYDGKLPKGYVKWCRENKVKFYLATLQKFITEQNLKQWPQSLTDTVKRFYEGSGFDLLEATNYNKELCAALIHIINNSLKRYEIADLITNLKKIIKILNSYSWLYPYLDDTKNAKTAYEILENVLYKERNEKILANESKIAALNGIVVADTFVIKVPSAMNDFTDEGEQQHNCVGYYYHSSMASGNTLIYFLRSIETPDKSYVTCRYRIDLGKTVEHRIRFNEWFDEEKVIEEVDNMINQILGM